jgi:succinylglutamate desuccinylase
MLNQDYYNYFQQNQNSALPFGIEFDSGKPGLHLMFVGSLHGHEPAGTIAAVDIHRMLVADKIQLKSGKVTFVLGNPEAFLDNQRFVHKNLNRAFLDDIEQNVEGKRVAEFRNYFISNPVNYVLDLHSVSSGDFKFVVCFDDPELRSTAFDLSPIDTHLIVNARTLPGSLMEEASRFGAKSWVFECGNNADPQTVEVAKYHIISSMIYFDMVDDTQKLPGLQPFETVCIYTVKDYIVPGVGFEFIDPLTTTGSYVYKDQVYARLGNGFEYVADEDYYIVIPDLKPKPNDHDAGFLCSRQIVNRLDRNDIFEQRISEKTNNMNLATD